MGRVSGKIAIVTGAARGMGAAFARRLVEEGARVMMTDIRDEEGRRTAQALGDHARFTRHDVTKEADWKRVVAETEAAFGPVSVLINNAGIAEFSPIETTEEKDFRRTLDINQVGVFLGIKSVLSSMKRAGGGAIINISSAAGIIGFSNMLAYNASKFAVRGMTKSAAIELAPHGIRVNSIHPGIIRTPMNDESTEAAMIAEVSKITPIARFGEPDEVAAIVLLLASDECRFSTGAEFKVDGGITCQ